MNRDEATKKLQEIIGKDLVKIAADTWPPSINGEITLRF